MVNNYCQVVPQTYEEKVEMYMNLDKKQIIDMLIEANDVIDRLLTPTPNKVEPITDSQRWKKCNAWEDCTNPHRDCINCPLRYKSYSNDFANSNINPEWF